jgi:hypothetical protein
MDRLSFTRKPPKLGGSRKVLIALNLKAFEEALTRWPETLLRRPIPGELSPPEAFAVDGNSVGGSFDGLEKAVHLLCLLAHESGLTLAQTAVPNGGANKTDVHKKARRMLEGIVLEGRLITGDAMCCQCVPYRTRGFFPLDGKKAGRTSRAQRQPSTRGTVVVNIAR